MNEWDIGTCLCSFFFSVCKFFGFKRIKIENKKKWIMERCKPTEFNEYEKWLDSIKCFNIKMCLRLWLWLIGWNYTTDCWLWIMCHVEYHLLGHFSHRLAISCSNIDCLHVKKIVRPFDIGFLSIRSTN